MRQFAISTDFEQPTDLQKESSIISKKFISITARTFSLCAACLSLIVLFLSLTDKSVQAQDIGSGLDFLNISPSTHLLAISEAQSATPAGASAIYSNPALLAFEPNSGLDLSYTLWISDVNNQFAAVNLRNNNRAIGFGIYNSRSDDFAARDQPGEPSGTFAIGYLSLAGAYAYNFGPISLGVTAQYLREEVFQFRANGFALSAGAAARFLDNRLRVGAVLMNLGEMQDLDIESTTLPTTFRAGLDVQLIEFTTPGFNDLPILFSVHSDWMLPLTDNPSSDFISDDPRESFVNIGLTADIADIFYLKSGLKFGPSERPYSLGAGFLIDPIKVNYALVPFTTGFGTVHSIGMQYSF